MLMVYILNMQKCGLFCHDSRLLPVLLSNSKGTEVAAVHAGWRGLANGIVENAVAQFDSQVMAWIGPAIGVSAFEVGEDVVDAFVSKKSLSRIKHFIRQLNHH